MNTRCPSPCLHTRRLSGTVYFQRARDRIMPCLVCPGELSLLCRCHGDSALAGYSGLEKLLWLCVIFIPVDPCALSRLLLLLSSTFSLSLSLCPCFLGLIDPAPDHQYIELRLPQTAQTLKRYNVVRQTIWNLIRLIWFY